MYFEIRSGETFTVVSINISGLVMVMVLFHKIENSRPRVLQFSQLQLHFEAILNAHKVKPLPDFTRMKYVKAS